MSQNIFRSYSRRSVLAAGAGAALATAFGAAGQAQAAPARTRKILVGDQASRRILLLDPHKKVWDPVRDPSCVLWSYTPDGDSQFADLEPEKKSWNLVSEVKGRRLGGRTYVLTTASFGFAAVVEYPTGKRYWGHTLTRGSSKHNPHSIELLPDGNVAVAASTGNEIRLYAASQGPHSMTFAKVMLEDAHGLQWDDGLKVLWAVGKKELVAYRVGGTAAKPTLTKSFAVPLPSPNGHDLGQVAADTDRLWVTSGSTVYQYVKSTRSFRTDYAGANQINRVGVKAIGDDPRTGQVLSTGPESGLPHSWWTQKVTAHRPDATYTLVNGGMYKARWWVD